ncbi:hypothetical protein CB1_000465073 [Camelus ferus]|nr:hypothetical protein CB1_000465073 [Camelus ferus]
MSAALCSPVPLAAGPRVLGFWRGLQDLTSVPGRETALRARLRSEVGEMVLDRVGTSLLQLALSAPWTARSKPRDWCGRVGSQFLVMRGRCLFIHLPVWGSGPLAGTASEVSSEPLQTRAGATLATSPGSVLRKPLCTCCWWGISTGLHEPLDFPSWTWGVLQ